MTGFRSSWLILDENKYNRSWDNERSIEIPLIQEVYESLNISKFNKTEINVLEIGNVLSNYEKKLNHDIVDKYEKGPRVKNVDFLDYKTPKKYDYIFSVSTFEHIGFDYGEEKNIDKALKALRKVQSMLKPKGKAYITIPVGFNKELDKVIVKGIKGYDTLAFKRTKNWGNTWEQCSVTEASKLKYGEKYENANAIFVLFIDLNTYKIQIDSEELIVLASILRELKISCIDSDESFNNTSRVCDGLMPKFRAMIEEEKEYREGVL